MTAVFLDSKSRNGRHLSVLLYLMAAQGDGIGFAKKRLSGCLTTGTRQLKKFGGSATDLGGGGSPFYQGGYKCAGMVVSAGLSLRKCGLLLAFVLPGALALSGCESDSYSEAIRYLLRTDPLVTSDKLGDERYNPDRPGQLPIMSREDLREFPNPFFEKPEDQSREDLFKSQKLLDPKELKPEQRQKLLETLDELFGTPRHPKVGGIEPAQIQKLKLDEETLELGSRYYRKDCLHCHGVTGNGRGPTARWVNPHPRDYRQGLFKFQSVDQAKEGGTTLKPRREDLMHTLMEGLEGTAMPSFRLLSQKDLNALVSYVIHLSIRGEAEYVAIKVALTDPEADDPAGTLREYTKTLGTNWAEAQDKAITVPPYPYKDSELKASIQRGHALFRASEEQLKTLFPGADMDKLKGASCVSCHKDYGRQSSFKFDSWGTLIKPTDLTRGVYRGGRTPTDFYYRIHSGINGANMASFGVNLTTNQIWDLINFIRVLPYPGMRESNGVQIN
jgi:mono/diheme cytochrome c family protein